MEASQSFDSFEQWCNKASSWLTRHPQWGEFFKAICFDSTGKICRNGKDFKEATYPVYWIWPDQNLFSMVDSIKRKANDKQK